MTVEALYSGVLTPDIASLTVGGVTFRCFVYRNVIDERIEAKIFADGEDGQLDLVHEAILATAVLDFVDCPRVLAANGLFVAHWIDWDEGIGAGTSIESRLYRALIDPTDLPSGWANQGNVAIDVTNLYDHSEIDGDPTEFVVARRTAAGSITSTRYTSPFTWLDTDWSNVDAGLTIADTVLGVFASDSEGVVLIGYQDTFTLQAYSRDSITGANLQGPNEVFDDLDTGDNVFTVVSFCCPEEENLVCVVEAARQSDHASGGYLGRHRMLGWRVLGRDASPQHESHWLFNLNVISKCWVWAAGSVGFNDVYVGCGFRGMREGQLYNQSYAYVVRLDYNQAAGANAPGVIRPIPVSAIMGGSIDGQPRGSSPVVTDVSIGARMNHVSQASGPPQYTLGPDHATMTFAVIRFSRLMAVQDDAVTVELTPIQGGVGWVRHYHENPWSARRDPKQPTQPDTPAWRGTTRTMCLPVNTSGGLVLGGGVTTTYDGQQPVELGFLWTPEIVAIEAVGAGGSMDDAATYFWYVNYSWVDARGQLHRSAPSVPVSADVVVNGFVNMYVRPANLTMKDDTRRYPTSGSVNIEVWRTYTDGGGNFDTNTVGGVPLFLFRREYAGPNPSYNLQSTPISDSTEWRQLILAGRSNSAEVMHAELSPFQLDLNTLQWTPPPPTPHRPLSIATAWLNRLWGVDPEDDRVLWYSEPILPIGVQYVWPEFLDTNTFRVDGIGEITALQPMDNRLVLFTRDGVYSVSGRPATGGGGATLELQTIALGIGCVEPRSVQLTTEGVFFQSAKGIHRLSRGTSIDYPGAPIEDLVRDAGNVRSSVHIENRHEVRYTLQALPGTGPLDVRPRIAIFNYRVGAWAIRVLPALAQSSTASRLNEMSHAAVWRGRQGEVLHVVLQQGGLAIERADDDTVYADVGAAGTFPIPLDITTEWIHLSGIAGLKRLKEIGIQTERLNPGEMTIDAWYDVIGGYDDSGPPATTRPYTAAETADGYLRFRPDIEKLSGIKLRIYESGTVPQTENLRLVSMTLIYARKPSNRRVRLQGA